MWWYRSRVMIADDADGTPEDGFLLNDNARPNRPASHKATFSADGLKKFIKLSFFI